MDAKVKKRIVFLRVLTYEPRMPIFAGRYQNLPQCFDSHVIIRTHEANDGITLGGTVVHAIPLLDRTKYFKNVRLIFHFVKKALKVHSEGAVDVVHAYDPLTLGIVGVLVKKLTGARLIIEVNGHLLTAGFLEKMTWRGRIKKEMYRAAIGFSLRNADTVKLLNHKMFEEHIAYLKNKRIVYFGDYIPTECFSKSDLDDNYVFFAGFPFFLKGVDLLIKAFLRLADDFPAHRLIILGFNPYDLDSYRAMAAACPRIEFHEPVHYDRIIGYIERCSCLVLPSRSEALGRVLIEAMACGKALIGARVGGIPEVIDHEENGLLFEPGNVQELESSMRRLLSDAALRARLGNSGYEKMKREYASDVYLGKFTSLLLES